METNKNTPHGTKKGLHNGLGKGGIGGDGGVRGGRGNPPVTRAIGPLVNTQPPVTKVHAPPMERTHKKKEGGDRVSTKTHCGRAMKVA